MKAKQFLWAAMIGSLSFFTSCGNDNANTTDGDASAGKTTDGTNPKGIGKFQNVELSTPVDEGMVASGKNIYEVKCASCHKLTDEKLVGPGLAKVTERRTPEWIMNFITNTDEMIEKDTAAQRMLEQCLVRMPNQGLSDKDARDVLEFMRKNDGQ